MRVGASTAVITATEAFPVHAVHPRLQAKQTATSTPMPGAETSPMTLPDVGTSATRIWKVIVMGKDMDRESADRIIAAADRDPDSSTATSGFADRADAAATRNQEEDEEVHRADCY